MKIKEILDRNPKSDTFSLTGVSTKYIITPNEANTAVDNIVNKLKAKLKKSYNKNEEIKRECSSFEKLYKDIEEECIEFYNKKNNNWYSLFKRTTSCSFIADTVGKTTKYGKNNSGLFWNFYYTIGSIVDYKNNNYSRKIGKKPINQVPKELRDKLLKYEISFYNSVTQSAQLMIIYYFKLDKESKKYLLKYETDYDLDLLQDLTLYEKNKEVFYSCTHEKYNSYEESC